jgi:hypothetical protein
VDGKGGDFNAYSVDRESRDSRFTASPLDLSWKILAFFSGISDVFVLPRYAHLITRKRSNMKFKKILGLNSYSASETRL